MNFTTFRKRIIGSELGLWKANKGNAESSLMRMKYDTTKRPKDSVTVFIKNENGKHMMVNITKEELERAGLVWRDECNKLINRI
jgi:hypothetical protein